MLNPDALEQVIASNLKLQIALQEQQLNTPMFDDSYAYNCCCDYLNNPPLVPFQLSPTNYSNSCGCCAGPPRDVRTVPCDVLMSGYRPAAEAYCCSTGLPTDLEIANRILETVAPYQARADYQQYRCCRK